MNRWPPILVTQERAAAGAADSGAAGTASALAADAADAPTEFEATFGKLGRPQAPAAAPAGAGAARAVGEEAWRSLFDVPSHALPSLTALCPAFLDSLLADGAPPVPGAGGAGA